MGCLIGSNSLFNQSQSNYLKFQGSDLIAVEGPNTVERQLLGNLRIPYSQILRGRVTLKAGQVDYLMNHLGLGDNATFLSISATYDSKSKIESDNYVVYNFSDDLSKNRYFYQVMILTGNSENRIPQLYLTNPNTDYDVKLDIMVATIDDTYNFFNDTVNQSGLSFTGLEVGDIKTYVINESIVINDKSIPSKPLLYLKLSNINSIERNGLILIIDDQSYGTLFLKFLTQNDANQSFSLINYILDNPNVDIDNLVPVGDQVVPTIYFYSRVDNTGDFISFNGMTSGVPYDTSDGFTFSTTIQLSTYGVLNGGTMSIDRNRLIQILISSVSDNRDGTMSLTSSNLVLTSQTGVVSSIMNQGTYSVTFNFSDLAQNYLEGVKLNLTII